MSTPKQLRMCHVLLCIGYTHTCILCISLKSNIHAQVQERVVTLLAARLSDNQDTDAIIHLLHSLGNTGSKAAVRVLLDYLKEEDLDVQLAAIPSLRMHISSERVQAALTQLLEMSKNEEVGFICMQCNILFSLFTLIVNPENLAVTRRLRPVKINNLCFDLHAFCFSHPRVLSLYSKCQQF